MIEKVAKASGDTQHEHLEQLRKIFPQFVKDGEIDFDSAEVLAVRLRALIDHGALVVVLDATHVTFLDSSGLRVIVAAANRFRAQGGQLFIEGMSGAVQRVLEITGLLDHLRIRPRQAQPGNTRT